MQSQLTRSFLFLALKENGGYSGNPEISLEGPSSLQLSSVRNTKQITACTQATIRKLRGCTKPSDFIRHPRKCPRGQNITTVSSMLSSLGPVWQHRIKSRGQETPPQYEPQQYVVAETLMRASVVFSCEPVGSERAWIFSLTSELIVLLEKSASHWIFSLSPLIPSTLK